MDRTWGRCMGETGGRERDNEDLPHPAQPGGAGGRRGGERGERETMSITLGGTLGRSSDWLSGRECIDPNRCVCVCIRLCFSLMCVFVMVSVLVCVAMCLSGS